MRLLEELSASQWGMVTTAQAAAHGVPRLDLSRLCQSGHLERLAHGFYRDAGAPSEEFESLRAVWLAADPSHTAEQRLPGPSRAAWSWVRRQPRCTVSVTCLPIATSSALRFAARPNGPTSATAGATSSPATSRSPTASR